MKSASVIIVLYLVIITVFATQNSSNENGVYNYHKRIGIPEAHKIKQLESSVVKTAQRIVGGSEISINQVPYQAGLVITILLVYTSVCGGCVLSSNRILTAAHCYTDGETTAESITVVLGSNFLFTGGTRVEAISTILHSGYNPITGLNDIAILHIPTTTFTTSIRPIALPSGTDLNEDFAGSITIASGYGIKSDGQSVSFHQSLSAVSLEVITNRICQTSYGSLIQSSHICTSGTGGVGTCGGDSGGPLALSRESGAILIGVTSFGAQNCEESHPSAFTRVTEFISWINANMDGSTETEQGKNEGGSSNTNGSYKIVLLPIMYFLPLFFNYLINVTLI